ncbi:hypothetical protein NCAS_0B01930 [Naumovozyma castellii]|uniref:Elongator complex protein 4 n=1 Tax=Naumovozyma castellii TaxID=27288 RepID=G0VBF1_NAUCA|nr:hypothetical protein NCAS_0B01930 [Naumovozyma castellii CBS 4309]CCC68277.1 hypothetical protein NCAS_0B01930 [Naumovozyma castellii CBS 4309]
MSFRKRGEVLNGRESTARGVSGGNRLPQRTPLNTPMRGPVSGSRQPTLSGRMANLKVREQLPVDVQEQAQAQDQDLLDVNHPGIRPSPVSAHLSTSTGCSDLDKVLTHQGLPLGNSILVEEQGTTEFNSILSRLFAAQGVVYNRIGGAPNAGNTHLIVLSLNQSFAKELPGIYKGSRKDVKKSQISEEQSKISVQNLNEQNNATTPQRYKDFKIAWKYRFHDEKKNGQENLVDSNENEYRDYNHQFDITSRMMPAPTSSEITFISPIQPIPNVITQLEKTINLHSNKLIRIIIPSLLHPAMYPPKMFNLTGIIALLHGLRSIIKKYGDRCVMFGTISSDLFGPLLLTQLENLFDSVVKLEPFPQEMLQWLEKIYKSQPSKVQHGLLHVFKLPVFSERGEMRVTKSEWAFRNGRKKFEIEEWSIPVEDTEDENPNQKNEKSMNRPENNDPTGSSGKSTTISLDY